MNQKNRHLKWFYLIILSIIWGSSFILIKKSLLGVTAFQLGALRNVFTGFILIIVGRHTLSSIPKSKWKWLCLSGFLGSFFPAFFFAIAETEIDSAVVSILNALVPLNTIIVGFMAFKISSTTRQIVGVLVGFIGTTLLILNGAALHPDQNYYYAGFVIASTLMYAININIIKRYLQDVKPLAIATGNYVFISIPALLVLYATDFFSTKRLNHPLLFEALGYIVVLSVFGTALAKIMFNTLVQLSTPVFASSVTYIMPIVAVAWGLIDGESFGWLQTLALVLILLGVYLSHKKNRSLLKLRFF